MRGWFGGASAPIARTGGVWGDVPPSEAGKFCIFATEIVQFDVLGANLEQAVGKKNTQFFGPDWPKFCILGEIFDKILLESFKSAIFRANSVDFF